MTDLVHVKTTSVAAVAVPQSNIFYGPHRRFTAPEVRVPSNTLTTLLWGNDTYSLEDENHCCALDLTDPTKINLRWAGIYSVTTWISLLPDDLNVAKKCPHVSGLMVGPGMGDAGYMSAGGVSGLSLATFGGDSLNGNPIFQFDLPLYSFALVTDDRALDNDVIVAARHFSTPPETQRISALMDIVFLGIQEEVVL